MSKINGVDSLLAKIEALGGNVEKSLKTSILQATKNVQRDAKMLAPVKDGTLRNSIKAEVTEKKNKVIGRVYTNIQYAPYVEFGTGPVGEQSRSKLTEKVRNQIQFKQDGWWIHESQIDAKTAELYKFLRIETVAGVFYYTEGQPPQPFLYPAAEQNKDKIGNIIKRKLQEDLRKLRRR